MKILLRTTALLLAASLGLHAAEPLTLAVLDFQSPDNPAAGEQAAILLNAKLSADAGILLVERAELDKILAEQQLALSGTMSNDTAAKVGQLTGAKVLVTGRVFRGGTETYLTAKIMGTETSRVFGAVEKFPDADGLDAATDRLTAKISATLEKQAGALIAKVETEEEHIARLRQLVAGKTLPTVSVSIPEIHIGRRAVDPAAQTELQKLLAAAGFTLVDAGKPADFELKGEAFSEAAGSRANLFFCRARVEITLHRRADGALVLSDRQTTAGVDLAEMTAGKNALQNAGAKLADRVAAALVK